MSRSVWLGVLVLAATAAGAAAEQPLRPFQATYRSSMGLLSATGQRSLERDRDGHWVFQNNAKVLGLQMSERTILQVQDHRLLSLDYHFVNAFRSSRNLDLRFDWDRHEVVNAKRGDVRKLPDRAYDRLGWQLQLQQDVCSDPSGFHQKDYVLVDTNKFKTYRVEALGRESLETKVGHLDTIKLRQTRVGKDDGETLIWLAPKWDCLVAQLEQHGEDGDYTLRLLGAEVGGRRVEGSTAPAQSQVLRDTIPRL